LLAFRHRSDERNPDGVTRRVVTMNPHVSGITLGVKDVNRAKQFYSKGLGWPIQQEHGEWVSFSLNNGSSTLGLLPRDSRIQTAISGKS
jgi:predicted enzyme related to lactoylglutathione lyase